jgi:hypothetical protein
MVLDEPKEEDIKTFDKIKILIEERIENYSSDASDGPVPGLLIGN